MPKIYTNEFLISELHRFYIENGRVPTTLDMQGKFGYPSFSVYHNRFGSFNNVLKIAGFELNKIGKLDGTETCCYCGKRADEIPNFGNWYYHDGIRYCNKHGSTWSGGIPDYVKGNLDISTTTGIGRVGEILVVKTLEIGKEHDCNRISCGYSFDMYHEQYGKIDVKTSLLSDNRRNRWVFLFMTKKLIDTYICVGLSSNRSNVEHVWVVLNNNNKKSLSITNSFGSLDDNNNWEVDSKPYNDMWQTMKLDSCKIMTDKSKNYL